MVTYAKISPKSGEPQRYSWGTQKKKKKKKYQADRETNNIHRQTDNNWQANRRHHKHTHRTKLTARKST